jgi:hypothetical protein
MVHRCLPFPNHHYRSGESRTAPAIALDLAGRAAQEPTKEGGGKERAMPPAGWFPISCPSFLLCCLSVSVPSLVPYFAYVTLICEVGAVSHIPDTYLIQICGGYISRKYRDKNKYYNFGYLSEYVSAHLLDIA